MLEFIEKQLRSAKIYRLCLLILSALVFISIILTCCIQHTQAPLLITCVLLLCLMLAGIFYLGLFIPITSNINWLRKKA